MAAKIKALFLDIDGTLLSFATRTVPPSTAKALEEAKKRGVRIYISTGRPTHFINNIAAIEPLIDGYMTTNGAYCTSNGETIVLCPIAESDTAAALRFIDEHHIPTIVMGKRGIGIINRTDFFDEVICGMLQIDYRSVQRELDYVAGGPVLQITSFVNESEEASLMAQMPHSTAARWHHAFCDITAKEADKGKGLTAIARHLGIDITETMAMGDGGNDIAMLRAAGIGVAMGNATDAVKTAADYVTASVDDDGLAQALRLHGVID